MTPITVNHKEIPESVIGQEMQYHPAATRQEAWQRAVEALVLRELLLQEAHREAVASVDNDEAELIDALLARVLRIDEPETADCETFYEAQQHRFVGPDQSTLPFAQVETLIRAELQARALRQALTAYLQGLVARAEIRGIRMGQGVLPVMSLN